MPSSPNSMKLNGASSDVEKHVLHDENEVWQGNKAVIVEDKQMTEELAAIFLLGKNQTNKA